MSKKLLSAAVIVAALGNFVDIFDLLLFSAVRIKSLHTLNVPDDLIMSTGISLINLQMIGLLVGGIIWGIIGDKRGRVSVLFGSILLYSLANIANAFVTDVQTYGILRFISGLGLAGELGAGITLVAEILPKEIRGYGTMIVACSGILGAVVASVISNLFFWRTCFLIGGCMGLVLLVFRVSTLESKLFEKIRQTNARRGDFFMLFTSWPLFLKYIRCILAGTPIWFVMGILMTFSPELAKALNIAEPVNLGQVIIYSNLGFFAGDFLSGYLSQIFRTRKRVMEAFIIVTLILTLLYVFGAQGWQLTHFYILCTALGAAVGYWAVFITASAENFGTNLRATVATTVPNFVRGAVVPLTLGFKFLGQQVGLLNAALILGILSTGLAFWAATGFDETFGRDLDYLND